MRARVPYASLVTRRLPEVPEIRLCLLADDYPQHKLSAEQAQSMMDLPPYWAFCWASGQVLARYLLDKPDLVSAKVVVDFGCGSGVAGIAAAVAGAKRVLVVDSDQSALMAAQYNAALNGIEVECHESITALSIDASSAVILVADVFYDRENLPMLTQLIADFALVLVADSRVTQSSLPGVTEVARYTSHTVPDLAESSEFNNVSIYQS